MFFLPDTRKLFPRGKPISLTTTSEKKNKKNKKTFSPCAFVSDYFSKCVQSYRTLILFRVFPALPFLAESWISKPSFGAKRDYSCTAVLTKGQMDKHPTVVTCSGSWDLITAVLCVQNQWTPALFVTVGCEQWTWNVKPPESCVSPQILISRRKVHNGVKDGMSVKPNMQGKFSCTDWSAEKESRSGFGIRCCEEWWKTAEIGILESYLTHVAPENPLSCFSIVSFPFICKTHFCTKKVTSGVGMRLH